MDEKDLTALLAKERTKRTFAIGGSVTIITAVISAAVSIFTVCTNFQMETLTHEREILKYEMEYVKGFIDTALQEDIQLRLRLAEYYMSVSYTPDQQERWERYYLSLKAENDQ
jgi:hypothetical protein